MEEPQLPAAAAPEYRLGVAAILEDAHGRILICERLDHRGGWQFPQGGLEPGELPETGLIRELREETSLEPAHYRIGERRGPYRYVFPAGRTKHGHHGQEQTYFRLKFLGADSAIDLATEHPEFRAWQWIAPGGFRLDWLPPMKRDIYRRVFQDFFGLEIS